MLTMISHLLLSLLVIMACALFGSLFILFFTGFIHRITDRLTPNINEDKEILRGNQAVAEYFGRVAAATIIGVSMVVAAAVFAGISLFAHY